MAQNITLQGASYSAVPSILLPKVGGGQASFVDVTDTTATAADVASGKYFYTSSGVRTQGTSSGGGGSGVIKVASTSYTVSTTSTSAATVATWDTGHTEIWTSDKVLYVKVIDHAGKRDGYFYASHNFFIKLANITSTTNSNGLRLIVRYQTSTYAQNPYTGTTGYGVYADQVSSDGSIRIRRRYNSGTSLTINGTYDVEAYLIDVGTLFT